jgi:hypothetical protein
MAMREKLDRAAIKISLEQWLAFEIGERRRLCNFPIDAPHHVQELADFLRELVKKTGGPEPSSLSAEQQRAVFPTQQLPGRVAANAKALGFELTAESWARLDGDARYALLKLGGGQRVKRNFVPALKEFLDCQRTANDDSVAQSRQLGLATSESSDGD